MCKNFLAFFLSLLLICQNCFAQTAEYAFWSNIVNDFIAPWSNLASQEILVGGLGLSAGLELTREFTSYPLQAETVKNRPMGSYSKYGDFAGQTYPNILYFLGMEAYSYYADDPEAHEFAIVMLKSTLYSGLVTEITKKVVQEPRPGDPTSKESFPSAHATRAFAFASTVYELHGSSWGIPAYILATGVAYSRMNDNRHYVHDVLAGAAIGASFGISLARRYINKKEKQSETSNSEFTALPVDGGLALGFRYTF